MTGKELKLLMAKIPDEHPIELQVFYSDKGYTTLTLHSRHWPFVELPPGILPESQRQRLPEQPRPNPLLGR